ncbi:hypothetical protein BTO20_33805 [Mycobacterium dioxanotrophicus]|uniref:Uncharacterized protein n=2 Tax=Mycobacterium dioxanotrophicus TaxID=482462 RepID=A0A1Y0CCV1_9MYCO|nr:hypothetical protein BTO20_33805 [Mycobacterium dioxanotrophicus]
MRLMTISFITASLAAISLLLNTGHHRRWWSPVSVPAVITAFVWLLTALSCIGSAIEAVVHEPNQSEAQAVLWVFGAIFPLLFAVNAGGPAFVHGFYREAMALDWAKQEVP